jgi:hypothetical protein
MFDGKVEIRRSPNNVVIMKRWVEDERLLNMKGTSTQANNFSYLSHHDEGTFSLRLLWNDIFGNINYYSLHMLKKNGVYGFPTIPRNLKQCVACILGKHNQQPFHDSTSRACRNIELIHSNLCGSMHVTYAFGNKYIMTFIVDYTRMCWVIC